MRRVLCMAAVLAVAADVPKDGSLTDEMTGADLYCLQGVWVLQGAVYSGMAVSKESLAKQVFLIKGDTIRITCKGAGGDDVDESGTITIDTTQKLKAIDFRLKEKVTRAVYCVEGDVLRVCVGGSEERPKGLSSLPRSGAIAMSFKRVRR